MAPPELFSTYVDISKSQIDKYLMKISEIIKKPEYYLKRHQDRQDPSWREREQQRYQREEEMLRHSRHIPKSQIGYKPFGIPLIRFGRFGKQSQIGLYGDADDQSEVYMTDPESVGLQASHESGVSVYRGLREPYGWLVCEPDRSSYNMTDTFAPIDKFKVQLIRYLNSGVPMDIFLLYGHLVSLGRQNEYLDLGSDGEYLLDTRRPYRQSVLKPEEVFMGRGNLIDWFEWRYKRAGGIAGIRQQLRDEEAELGLSDED
jgi:hypothetical protein